MTENGSMSSIVRGECIRITANKPTSRSHVKNDLDPYICLFEDCNQPDYLFNRSEEWIQHMHTHASLWRCRSHGKDPFPTREAYMDHLRQVHHSNLSDTQLRALADRNCRRMGKLFESCPLCGKNDVNGSLDEHIVGHLRSLALKSLPAYEEDSPSDHASEVGAGSLGSSKPQSRSTIKEFGGMIGGEAYEGQNDETEPFPPDVPFFVFGESDPASQEIVKEYMRQASQGNSRVLHESWKFIEEKHYSPYDPNSDRIIRSMLEYLDEERRMRALRQRTLLRMRENYEARQEQFSDLRADNSSLRRENAILRRSLDTAKRLSRRHGLDLDDSTSSSNSTPQELETLDTIGSHQVKQGIEGAKHPPDTIESSGPVSLHELERETTILRQNLDSIIDSCERYNLENSSLRTDIVILRGLLAEAKGLLERHGLYTR